jgi:glycerol-3-phosphate dehydrogenase
VIFAARSELARGVDDVLSRRTRSAFLDTEASLAAAPLVASLLAAEFGRDAGWEAAQRAAFGQIAGGSAAALGDALAAERL